MVSGRASIFAMPPSSTALLFSVAFGLTNAMPWAGAAETLVYRADEFSPKPTGVPADPVKLFKRSSVDVNVCGWVNGDQMQVARCDAGSSCIHDTMHGYIGCCATAGPCTDGVFTSCVDEKSQGWSSTQGMLNNGVLTCSQSSSCFRNSFPNNYKQYRCGSSGSDAQVQTSFNGQPKDLRLQVVYTGVNFTPMSRKPSTTSTAASTDTPAAPGKSFPTDPSAKSTDSASPVADGPDYKAKTGAIAGGTVGGVIAIAAAAAIIIFCLRRQRRKKHHSVGGFVSMHQKKQHRTSGPFQRVRPYSPEDYGSSRAGSSINNGPYMSSPSPDPSNTTYISPFTGHPDESHRALAPEQADRDRDLIGPISPPMMSQPGAGTAPYNYETAVAVPISRLNRDSPYQQQNPFESPDDHTHSLTRNSEIDEFSRNWQQAVASQGYIHETYLQDRDTHIHSGDMPETTDVGLAGAVRRAASTLAGNSRSADPNARSEAMRQADAENMSWSAQQLRAAQLAEVGMGVGEGNDRNSPSSPIQEQVRRAFEAATRMGGSGGNTPLTPVRYQLVDDSAPMGDDVPVLQGPGQMRMHRSKKSE